MTKRKYPPIPKDKKLVFTAWRTCPKTGDKLWAKSFGFKAWPIYIDK